VRSPRPASDKRREHLILAVGASSYVIMNRYPYNNGHIMVVPLRHRRRPGAFSDDEWGACGEMVRQATRVLGTALGAHGFNVGMNLGRVAAPASISTATGTSSRAGQVTPTSCRSSAR
jgi:ATP adenylyltransferase